MSGRNYIEQTILFFLAMLSGFQAVAEVAIRVMPETGSMMENVSYVYEDVFNPAEMIVIDVTESLVVVGDVGRGVEICNGEAYSCFSDEFIAFAVPVRGVSARNEWEYRGVRYFNYGVRTKTFLNTRIDLYVIHADIKGINYRYLYSEKYGLVAIGILDPQTFTGRTYLLRDRVGFAHQDSEE